MNSTFGTVHSSMIPSKIWQRRSCRLPVIRSMKMAAHVQQPNPPLNSDPARNAFRSFSCFRLLGFIQRLGAGGSGWLHSLGLQMKPITALILFGTLVLHAENWELAGEEHNIKYYLNPEIKLASLGGESVVKIQSKIVFPSGLSVITIRYWRQHGSGWEAATKTMDSYEANGRLTFSP